MAVITWGGGVFYAYVAIDSPTIAASGQTVSVTLPPVYLAGNDLMQHDSPRTWLYGLGRTYNTSGVWTDNSSRCPRLYNGSTLISRCYANTNTLVSNYTYAVATWTTPSISVNTADLFKASNKTIRTVPLSLRLPSGGELNGWWVNSLSETGNLAADTSAVTDLATINITLDAPPTFDTTPITFDKNYIYVGITTASVTVSNLSAKYGGDITDVTFTIGNQSVSSAGAGTLSITPSASGTFTPTVTVTDSRGQTTTKSFDPITVNSYIVPSVSFTADRTLSSGVPDDEGTYATVDATFTFADVVADAVAPSVVVTDEGGTQTTPVVTWYSSRASDGTLSGSVTWSSLSSGDTVYGLIPNINTQYSYQISIRPRDTEGTGTAITQTLSSAFYTVDFLAGGHGIAFGKPSSNVGFECAMDATFEDSVFVGLSDYQTVGTTDKAIYDVIVSLGWDSDVLVN